MRGGGNLDKKPHLVKWGDYVFVQRQWGLRSGRTWGASINCSFPIGVGVSRSKGGLFWNDVITGKYGEVGAHVK